MSTQGTSSQSPPAPPAPPAPGQIREQVRRAIEEAQAGAEDAAAAAEAAKAANQNQNRVIIRNGQPVGADVHVGHPGSAVHVEGMGPMIPPQAVDIANGFFTMCAVMVVGWPLARAFGRRLERAGSATATLAPAMSEQLVRIEQAVEAMSIEVERISESQRFMAKLQNAPLSAHGALPGRDQG
jgi:hypothetical protein